MIIGMDIGGTHTDAVLVHEGKIISASKTLTTDPLEEGVKVGLAKMIALHQPQAIHIGTTHATNALLEGKRLFKTGVIRLAGHHPNALRPCAGWPSYLLERVFLGVETVAGGFECDLRSITPFNHAEVRNAAEKLVNQGAESLALIGVFSPILSAHEELAAAIIAELLGDDFPISCSSQIGGIGFVERENATLLNAALKRPMKEGFSQLHRLLSDLKVDAPLFLTQNNGSLIKMSRAIEYPLLTLSSGPTNSFIGASRLAGEMDAIVIDIGGTSTDIGCIQNGYPRRSMHNVCFGGVSLNFRTPDVLALSIGGGSVVSGSHVGPESCGSKLRAEAQIFGGNTLTLTDIASRAGVFSIPGSDVGRVKVSESEAKYLLDHVQSQILRGVEKMRGKQRSLPVIGVGGGAAIAGHLGNTYLEHQAVANAYGAALAEVSATIDTVITLTNRDRELNNLKDSVLQQAVDEGADKNSVRIVDLQVIPYHYVPNQLARVVVTASGKKI